MFLEELNKGWHWDIKGVVAIVVLESLGLRGGLNALGLLEVLKRWLWLGVNNICKRRERVLILVVEEAALLEKEGDVISSTSL